MATNSRKKPSASRGSVSSKTKPAEVLVRVAGFKDVLAPDPANQCPGTGYELKLRKKHPRVAIKGGVIFVKAPGATIQFILLPAVREKENYFPVGLTFVRESECSSSDAERLGLLNFPQQKTRPEGLSIFITDTYKDPDPKVRYKFSVVVQRGSDGRIGIIDPAISHDNSDLH